MQPFNMLLLALMAFVISLTSAAAIVSSSASFSLAPSITHPTGHPSGSFTISWKGGYTGGWPEWTGEDSHSHTMTTMTETGSPSSTSTIHLTKTVHITAREDEYKPKPTGTGMESSWTHKHSGLIPTGSFSGINSWTKGGHSISGGHVPSVTEPKTKRGDDVMTKSHHFSDSSPANSDSGIPRPPFTPAGFTLTAHNVSSSRKGTGHSGQATSTGAVLVTTRIAPPPTTMATMPSSSSIGFTVATTMTYDGTLLYAFDSLAQFCDGLRSDGMYSYYLPYGMGLYWREILAEFCDGPPVTSSQS